MENNKIALIEIGCERPELNEPLGICTIASYLTETTALSKESIDLYWNKVSAFTLTRAETYQYFALGISAQINSLSRLESFYNEMRSAQIHIPIIIGNLLGIYAAETLLSMFPDAIVCEGEGEHVFADFVRLVQPGKSSNWRSALHFVPGIAFRDGDRNIHTPAKLAPISLLPPPRRDFAAALFSLGGISRIESSRGCHWGRCEFCSVESRFGLGGYRRFPIDRVLTDLQRLADEGVLSPYFSDEDFFGRRYNESSELANAIAELKLQGTLPSELNSFCSVLASDVTNSEGQAALRAWRSAGLREVFVGVETGATPEIKRFAKKANVSTNTSAISILRSMGFQVDIGFIMFDPKMSVEDLKANVVWLRSQNLEGIDSRVTKRLRIQPRTKMVDTYADMVTGPLNVDELTYPSTFSDERVRWVAKEFGVWEDVTKQRVYRLLGLARGEVRSERGRLLLKQALAELRDYDLEYLWLLIEVAEGRVIADLDEMSSEILRKKQQVIEEVQDVATEDIWR